MLDRSRGRSRGRSSSGSPLKNVRDSRCEIRRAHPLSHPLQPSTPAGGSRVSVRPALSRKHRVRRRHRASIHQRVSRRGDMRPHPGYRLLLCDRYIVYRRPGPHTKMTVVEINVELSRRAKDAVGVRDPSSSFTQVSTVKALSRVTPVSVQASSFPSSASTGRKSVPRFATSELAQGRCRQAPLAGDRAARHQGLTAERAGSRCGDDRPPPRPSSSTLCRWHCAAPRS
jgi:hypothetical protein